MEKVHEIFRVPKQLISRIHEGDNELPEYRTEFMRDRDRLMYATAFRRLAGKTQIYTVGTDDHKKNRLTHTLEVSQIARTIIYDFSITIFLWNKITIFIQFFFPC